MANIEKAMQLIAENKIESAIKEGKFDNLKGFGKPFDFDDSRYDPHWWVRRKVERESMKNVFHVTPKLSDEHCEKK